MKYDVMRGYHEYLSARRRPATVSTYYKRLNKLLEGQNGIDFEKCIDLSKVIEKLSNVNYKNHFSQYKNALLYFCKFQNIQLSKKQLQRINELEDQTKKKRRKQKVIDKESVIQSINNIQNKKLKICFQTLFVTGLRVSELSQIRPLDCTLEKDYIEMSFIAKGGKSDKVRINKEEYPKEFESLKKVILSADKDKKVFYSSKYLQAKAKELNFHCHDLRRIYAHEEYKKTKSKVEVMEKLRHSSDKNTDIYLKARIK